MKEIIIENQDANQRLDKFLIKKFASKNFVYKMLRKKNIKLNNKKAFGNEILCAGDLILIFIHENILNDLLKTKKNKIKINLPIEVLHEDNNILICNKPAGILSQPVNKNDDSLLGRIYSYLNNFDAAICNRLDRNTSGIILCGKNFRAIQEINNLIANKKIEKFYYVFVYGKINYKNIVAYITKDKIKNKCEINNLNSGKKIMMEFAPIEYYKNFSLIKLKLITGRSHQVRAYMSSIKNYVIGDFKYGNKKINDLFKSKINLDRQLLHAYKIKFLDGEYKNLEIKTKIPEIFIRAREFIMHN